MDSLFEKISEWFKEILIGGITENLTGLFDGVNEEVGEIASQVGATPQSWNSGIYDMIRSLSESVIPPIAGVILAFVMTLELIQIITDKNNKWIFKTACAVLIVSNTWNIVMGVFELAQNAVNNASGVVVGNVSINLTETIASLDDRLSEMEIGQLLGLWLQSFAVGITLKALSICIFIIVYGRMLEIYIIASVAPVPLEAMANREWSMGQNYIKSLFALGFQGFLIIVCVAVYAVLVQNMMIDTDISSAIWSCMGYTVLLCFALFKTGSLSKSIFGSH